MPDLKTLVAASLLVFTANANAASGLNFEKDIQPILERYCYDCHGDGVEKGGLALDQHKNSAERLGDHENWMVVWENLRAQLMPPAKKDQPSAAEREKVMRWVERDVFKVDPDNPDPGRVTIRRLNRTEYENTVNDMLGARFEADEEFPPDDTGYGFDTIGDVLSLSPLLLEKYLDAAEKIVDQVVPKTGPRLPTQEIPGERFRFQKATGRRMPFAQAGIYEHGHSVKQSGRYRLRVEMRVIGSMEATSHSAKLALRANGRELVREDLSWDNRKAIYLTGEADLKGGANTFGLQIIPAANPGEGEHPLQLSVRTVYLQGPIGGSKSEYPRGYHVIFPDGAPPDDREGREVYAEKILQRMGTYLFRRPVDESTLQRLVALAIAHDREAGVMFEQGIARAMTAMLSSPRFLFRAEIQADPNDPGQVVNIDEFALASRLSYFLWSTTPDAELLKAAEAGDLRRNLRKHIDRMLDDSKARRFVRNFVGQWLQTRDVEAIAIDPRRILRIRDRGKAYRIFNSSVRKAMRGETEYMFGHLVAENRSALDLLNADYTFLNSTLAKFYGIKGVEGYEMRKVQLPEDSHRGGILTHGSILLVTSNPTRTSPVKRGLFVLENILGTPPPPAPPNVPELEEAVRRNRDQRLTMREALALHREAPLCNSCHARFDSIGLAMENFNALGIWREKENDLTIDTRGQLATGEKFESIRELSNLLATDRRKDFYRCLTEKLLTYALGRGMEYYDTPTIEGIVDKLDADRGRMRHLIYWIAESVPFQKRRGDGNRLLKD